MQEVRYDEPLRNYTTLKIGGPARAMYFPQDLAETVRLCRHLYDRGVAPYFLGNGSNILASDGDLNITVINTKNMKNVEIADEQPGDGSVLISAESGALLSSLAVFAQTHSLTGLEFAHGIPGTLGGAVTMNAGAYGSEMKDFVHSTMAFNRHNGVYTLIGDEHEFVYRGSVFSPPEGAPSDAPSSAHSDDIILSCAIRLEKGDRFDIDEKMQNLAARRRESQPLDMPSAGSTFKRPPGGYAAQLIDEAGLKGYAIGGAQVSAKHAGFIVNTGGASFDDAIKLIEHIQKTVEARTGILLEPEVKIWK